MNSLTYGITCIFATFAAFSRPLAYTANLWHVVTFSLLIARITPIIRTAQMNVVNVAK